MLKNKITRYLKNVGSDHLAMEVVSLEDERDKLLKKNDETKNQLRVLKHTIEEK